MRGKTVRGAWLLVAGLALLPATLRGQSPGAPVLPALAELPPLPVLGQLPPPVIRGQSQSAPGSPGYAPADPPLPIPLGSTRPEDGGLFLTAEYVMMHMTNPLSSGQPIAFRGFYTWDTSLGVPAGTFIGSGKEALNIRNLTGNESYQPGFNFGIGWKFKDGSALTFNWLYLTEAKYTHGATLAPRLGQVRDDFADSFLTAFVFNFPPEYSGPPNRINGGSSFVAYGIWDAANIMTIDFVQRFQQWDLTYRFPILDQENYRFSGVAGPRFAWIWERFKWVTTSQGSDGNGNLVGGPDNVGIYTNITSNRMYGVFAGCQNECYLGHGFALLLDTQASLYLNSVKERAKYELAAKFLGFPESKRAKRDFTIVPEFSGQLSLQWYPTEFIQVQIGYQLMYFLNTLTSRRPIDFNYTNVAPQWNHENRLFDGFRAGIAITF